MYFLIPNYQRKEIRDMKTLWYKTSFSTFRTNKKKTTSEECQGCPWLTHINRKGEQKALWNGMVRQAHIWVRWKKRTQTGGRNEKETDFKVPTAHGDRKWGGRAFDRVSLWVLTRLSVGLKTEVCVRVEVVCVSVQYTRFRGLTSARVLGLTGVVEERPAAPVVADIQRSVSLLGGRWQLSELNLSNTTASEDGLGGKNARVYISH